MTAQQPNTPPPSSVPCAMCGKPTAIIIGTRPICDACCERTDDVEFRLWRKSLKVVRGGLPL